MNNFYAFNGVYYFRSAMDPVLESELKKCKTQKERDDVVESYQTNKFIGLAEAAIIGALVCGLISLFTWCNSLTN